MLDTPRKYIADIQSPKNGDIALDNSTKPRERYFYNRHWIKYYPEHDRNDLEMALALVRAFEKRFQKSVEGGMETTADNQQIMRQQRCFDEAQKKLTDLGDNVASFEYLQAHSNLQVAGGMLAVSIYHRFIDNVIKHIRYRLVEKSGDKARLEQFKSDIEHYLDETFPHINHQLPLLDRLREAADKDYGQAYMYLTYAKRGGGKPDRDNVLKEMIGEAANIFTISRPETPENKIHELYKNRYKKISECWDNIDTTTKKIKQIVQNDAFLGGPKRDFLLEAIENASESAKSRCELMRSDDDFVQAAVHLRSNRDQIKNLCKEIEQFKESDGSSAEEQGDAVQRLEKEKNAILRTERKRTAVSLVRAYCNLIYDVAHVRTPRDTSAGELIVNIDKALIESRINQSKGEARER